MKLIKPNQTNYSKKVCKWCGSKAEFRTTWDNDSFACKAHSKNLSELENKQKQPESYSEADYQTWLRL